MSTTFASQSLEVALTLGDAEAARILSTDPKTVEWVVKALASGAQPVVRVRPGKETDTAGHAIAVSTDLDVEVQYGDDTEGHALSLRFPTVQDARDFELKVLAAGVLAGTLIAVGATMATAPSIPATGAGQATITSEQALREFRQGEIGQGVAQVTITSSGALREFRADEIAQGSAQAPGTGAGLAEFRADEIAQGSAQAPGTGAGLAEQRAGEINAGSTGSEDESTSPPPSSDSFHGR